MIVLIAAVSAGIAYFVASGLFGGMSEKGVKVQTVEQITSEVESVDTNIFNDTAINPSVEININNTDDTTSTTEEASTDSTTSQ